MALDDRSEQYNVQLYSLHLLWPQTRPAYIGAFAAARQHIMFSPNAAPTHFPRRSEPSDQSLGEHCPSGYPVSTEAQSLVSSSPTAFYQNPCSPQHPFFLSEIPAEPSNLSNYPSPPLDFQQPGNYCSLPPLIDLDTVKRRQGYSGIASCHFGGILDSPLVMSHSFIRTQAPLSPPLTIPTSTTSLPATEGENEGYLSSPFSVAHDLPDQENIPYSVSPLFDTSPPSSRSSCSTLQSPPPLSPVSPNATEWFSHNFPIAHRISLSPREKHGDGLPFLFHRDGYSPQDRDLAKLESSDTGNGFPLLTGFDQPLFSQRLFESPKAIAQAELDLIDSEDNHSPSHSFSSGNPEADLPFVAQAPTNNRHEPWPTAQDELAEQETEQLPVSTMFPPTFSPSIRNSSLPELDDLWDSDLDFPESLADLEPPPSPSRRPLYAELPEDDLSAPPALSSPDSQDTTDDTPMFSPPDSLGLISLPGADIDEDLIPADLASPKLSSDKLPLPLPRTQLFFEDDLAPDASSSRRSLSPEPCDTLDMNAVASQIGGNEELKHICSVMKRAKEREAAARWMEGIVEEEERVVRSIARSNHSHSKQVDEAWNKLMSARWKSRRLKEKVRATATLLRLKLAEQGWKIEKDASGKTKLVPKSPSPPPLSAPMDTDDDMKVDSQLPPKGPTPKRLRINNSQQLLAKMLMDRQEPLYNPSGRAGSSFRKRTSPLSRRAISADEVEYTDSNEDDRTIPDSVDIPDVEMRGVDDKEDLVDDLVENMGIVGFS
ncbi:hypothetical protein NP233_g6899 [Leucocoprinus birnbaumii]|uniref:Uncharacterized protein n=1 Tax=Leucocoprinus birnbaumii TaxID=56174 RepID=A0AAD5VQA4_9AGAR|nr:hypothetical protein NP233_g6899 [Leucocoprinus birnbaumii]